MCLDVLIFLEKHLQTVGFHKFYVSKPSFLNGEVVFYNPRKAKFVHFSEILYKKCNKMITSPIKFMPML